MIINGINYLFFERRGCEFFKGEAEKLAESDIGNYRITTPGEIVPGKDGRNYLFEFGVYDRYDTRFTDRRTGRALKHPKRELTMTNAAHVGTEYSDERGSWRNVTMEREFYKAPRKYTEKNILDYVNSISAEKYDAIKYVETVEVPIDEGRNFTPRELLTEYAEKHHIAAFNNQYFELIYPLYTGDYKYLCYEIEPGAEKWKVKMYLEKIA